MENIDIDIDKEISKNIKIDIISNRLEFGISNRARASVMKAFPTLDESERYIQRRLVVWTYITLHGLFYKWDGSCILASLSRLHCSLHPAGQM